MSHKVLPMLKFVEPTLDIQNTGLVLESRGMCAIFHRKDKKNFKKGKNGQNVWKFGQKYTKFQNILKKGAGDCVQLLHEINC